MGHEARASARDRWGAFASSVALLLLASAAFGCAQSGELVGTCRSDDDCNGGVCQAGRCEDLDTGPFDLGDTDADAGPDHPADADGDQSRLDVAPIDTNDEEVRPLGGFGDGCTANAECVSNYCIDGDSGRFCTELCNETCPEGYDCRVLANTGADAVRLCVPHRDVLCLPCTNDTQCGGFGAFCLEQDDGSFCATDCSVDRTCPEHYVCNVVVIDGAGEGGDDLVTRLCEPEVPACSGCLDGDGDEYGVGWGCLGPDCNDGDDDIHPGAPELCNGIDDNCVGGADETFDFSSSLQHCGGCDRPCLPELHEVTACLEGECARRCEAGWFNFDPLEPGCETPCTPNPETAGEEVCNFIDDDCNGITDDGFHVEGDPAWCGDCTPCELPHTDAYLCVSGVCRPDVCDAGWRHCDTDLENGCETDIWYDLDNCGGCGEGCALTDAVAECDQGDCVVADCVSDRYENCNGLDEDGCEADLWTELANCGGCDEPCAFPGAEAQCTETGCAMGDCLDEYYNLDPVAPGCEYGPCPGSPLATDLPDAPGTPLLSADADCDGIDGDIGRAVFVSASTGNNGSPNCAIDNPCQTLERALYVARTQGKSQVLVRAGVYNEIVSLTSNESGLTVYGGYDVSWHRGDHRSAPYETLIVGAYRSADQQYMTVRARGTNVTFDNVELVGPDAALRNGSGNGLSSYVVHAQGSTLTFRNVTFDQGNGYSGANGGSGSSASGSRPSRAGTGGDGSTYATACGINNGASGGAGRSNSSCPSGTSTGGGNGGRGGSMDQCCHCDPIFGVCECATCNCDATSGWTGNPANYTPGGYGSGGSGGRGGGSCLGGGPGGGGRPGSNGSGGSPGDDSGAIYSSLWWAAQDGGTGFTGADGTGGGGGGGGGGCDAGTDSSGAGGGGGGGGGCRAPAAGSAGHGGGGSFGIFALSSTVNVTGSTFQRGNGGRGGNGGSGGSGQPGGYGGFGGGGSGTAGGGGGNGGDGGDSGGGGGGGGGLSVGIYTYGSSVSQSGNSFTGGAGGAGGSGGASPGNDGLDGDTGAVYAVRACVSLTNC